MSRQVDIGAMLSRYESEIGRLNGVIIRMEAGHEADMTAVRTQMNEIVDLLAEASPATLQAYNERIAAQAADEMEGAPQRVEPATPVVSSGEQYVEQYVEHPELDGVNLTPEGDLEIERKAPAPKKRAAKRS